MVKGNKTHLVLVSKLFVERGGHDDSADGGGRAEVCFAGFSPRGVEGCEFRISTVYSHIHLDGWKAYRY